MTLYLLCQVSPVISHGHHRHIEAEFRGARHAVRYEFTQHSLQCPESWAPERNRQKRTITVMFIANAKTHGPLLSNQVARHGEGPRFAEDSSVGFIGIQAVRDAKGLRVG